MRVNEFLEYMNSGKTVKESENLKSSEAALVSENKSGRWFVKLFITYHRLFYCLNLSLVLWWIIMQSDWAIILQQMKYNEITNKI